MDLGKLLRDKRKQQKLTQEQLATGICDRSYLSLLEHNKIVPPVDLLGQLLARLNLSWYDVEAVMPATKTSSTGHSILNTSRQLYRR